MAYEDRRSNWNEWVLVAFGKVYSTEEQLQVQAWVGIFPLPPTSSGLPVSLSTTLTSFLLYTMEVEYLYHKMLWELIKILYFAPSTVHSRLSVNINNYSNSLDISHKVLGSNNKNDNNSNNNNCYSLGTWLCGRIVLYTLFQFCSQQSYDIIIIISILQLTNLKILFKITKFISDRE